jgi:hypothetical protein
MRNTGRQTPVGVTGKFREVWSEEQSGAFLATMDGVVPWAEVMALIKPF